VKTDPLRALSDPLRISLFELIKQGQKTTPELAEILNENRMNLYHHLKILEKAGLIQSSYNSDRVKVYRVKEIQEEIEFDDNIYLQQSRSKVDSVEQALDTLILSPPQDQQQLKKFNELIQEAAELVNVEIPPNYELLQVQVMIERQQYFRLKQTRSSSINQSKKLKKSGK